MSSSRFCFAGEGLTGQALDMLALTGIVVTQMPARALNHWTDDEWRAFDAGWDLQAERRKEERS